MSRTFQEDSERFQVFEGVTEEFQGVSGIFRRFPKPPGTTWNTLKRIKTLNWILSVTKLLGTSWNLWNFRTRLKCHESPWYYLERLERLCKFFDTSLKRLETLFNCSETSLDSSWEQAPQTLSKSPETFKATRNAQNTLKLLTNLLETYYWPSGNAKISSNNLKRLDLERFPRNKPLWVFHPARASSGFPPAHFTTLPWKPSRISDFRPVASEVFLRYLAGFLSRTFLRSCFWNCAAYSPKHFLRDYPQNFVYGTTSTGVSLRMLSRDFSRSLSLVSSISIFSAIPSFSVARGISSGDFWGICLEVSIGGIPGILFGIFPADLLKIFRKFFQMFRECFWKVILQKNHEAFSRSFPKKLPKELFLWKFSRPLWEFQKFFRVLFF